MGPVLIFMLAQPLISLAIGLLATGTAALVGYSLSAKDKEAIRINIQQNIKVLRKNSSQYKEQLENASEISNLDERRRKRQQAFFGYLSRLPVWNYRNRIPIEQEWGFNFVVLIGRTSVGKSSVYNWAFNLHLQTGADETTEKLAMVHHNEKTKRFYYDIPGFNDEIQVDDAEILSFFYQTHSVFILEDVTFKNIKKIIQILNKINPPCLYIVRTKCDMFKDNNQLSRAIEKDRKYLEEIGIKHKVLYISCKMNDNYQDNDQFKKVLKGPAQRDFSLSSLDFSPSYAPLPFPPRLQPLPPSPQRTIFITQINLNAGAIQTFLPTKEPAYLNEMDLIKDVPYIQSEHYDSSHTFATEADPDRSSSDENFTDEEQEIIQNQRPMPKQRKFVMLEEEDEFREQDFQFVANKRSNKDSVTTFPHSSTIYSKSQELNDNDLQIYRLQETAYFSQVPQQSMNPSKRLSYGEAAEKENMAHTINKKQPLEAVSRKTMFLNKIEKEKTKKDKIEIKARVNSKRIGK